jgi:hypothetical protein
MEVCLRVSLVALLSWDTKPPVDTRNLNPTRNDCEERSNRMIALYTPKGVVSVEYTQDN